MKCQEKLDCNGITKQYNQCTNRTFDGKSWTLRQSPWGVPGNCASCSDPQVMESLLIDRSACPLPCEWEHFLGQFLPNYSIGFNKSHCYEMEEAKTVCQGKDGCGGITRQYNIRNGTCWTIRNGSRPENGNCEYGNCDGDDMETLLLKCPCYSWEPLRDQFLPGLTSKGATCFEKEEAMIACQNEPDCNGITKQYNQCLGKEWTLRRGAEGVKRTYASCGIPICMESLLLDRSKCKR